MISSKIRPYIDYLQPPYLSWRIAKKIASAYTGATPNTHGDHDGTADPYSLFTVTGMVVIQRVFGICNTSLVGGAINGTIDIGTVADTNLFSATQLADADAWNAGQAWAGTAAAATPGLSAATLIYILDGSATDQGTIIETLAAQNINSGQVDWYCIWTPAEVGANVAAV